MTKLRVCLISAFLIIASIPWFFTEFMSGNILGFPTWAFYSICVTILYAIVTACFFNATGLYSQMMRDKILKVYQRKITIKYSI